jgi:hypothetical protein
MRLHWPAGGRGEQQIETPAHWVTAAQAWTIIRCDSLGSRRRKLAAHPARSRRSREGAAFSGGLSARLLFSAPCRNWMAYRRAAPSWTAAMSLDLDLERTG